MNNGKRDLLKMMGAGMLGAACSRAMPPKLTPSACVPILEDVSDRVINKGVLRASYIVFPPYFVKDPNTKALSGLYYDLIMRLAKDLDVKIEWIEEVTFANPFEGFYSDRYDIVAANIWPNGSRAKRADFTIPVCFNGFNVYMRAQDTRRFDDLSDLNRSDIRIALIEGEGFVPIAQEICPNAHFIFLPSTVSNAELALQLLFHKADATFMELAFANRFMRGHPNAIAPLTPDPIQVFPCGFTVARHQQSFQSLLNTLVGNMVNTGFVEGLLRKYEPSPGNFIRVAKPYQTVAV